uniref:DUF4283 domain-containing protein n=1 Tax=Quercus lobata TaxID=97700 RepID=A0A7N2MKJ4_QUELO
MIWKPNKGVEINELEEDLFLVEFGDERDKKKVLDMCPWSYEKQLVLLQDFEGELTPKEMELKWSPFWVQIFNLPRDMSRIRGIQNKINFTQGIIIPSDGRSGGLAMLWKEGTEISFKSYSNSHIDVVIRDDSNPSMASHKLLWSSGGE